jgi:hypothetical protein
VICLNGDTIDGATLSRFPRAGWEYRPILRQEVQAAQAFLADVRKAAPKAHHILVRGNHCQRVENALANKLPEFEGMIGTRFEDLFPYWTVCWSLHLPSTTIKHRWHNGQNATRQNALKSGSHYVTDHLHSLQVTAVLDLSGTRYGIDTGTLADPYGPQFRYCEGAPRDHRSGWVFLTYQNGNLLWSELGAVTDQKTAEFCFRGRIERVPALVLH